MTDTVVEPDAPANARHLAPRGGPSPRWMIGFCSLLALAVTLAGVLTYAGVKTVRTSRAGQAVSTITDPAAPGFEAFLEPTPTLALIHRDGKRLLSMAVLALSSGDAGGSLLLVSPSTQSSPADDAVTFASVAAYLGDPTLVLSNLQAAIDYGVAELAVVDDARWAELVAPVAPLEIDNPTAVGDLPAGPITLGADRVGPYLAAKNDGEDPEVALDRQRAFYEAWFAAVSSSSDPAPVPGEVATGIGRFARGLAAGPRRIETAPVTVDESTGIRRIEIDPEAMQAMVAELVAFPTAGAPGGRVRVRLLDGAGDPQHLQRVAPLVIPADAEIVVVGNADAFDHRETQIRYHALEGKMAARRFQQALGAGQVIDDPRQTDAFDVTIVLGRDL